MADVLARAPGAVPRLRAHLDVALERCLSRLLARWPEAEADRADLRQGLDLHLVRDDFRVLRTYRGDARLTTWAHAVATRYFFQEIQRVVRGQRPPVVETAAAQTPEQAVLQADRRARVQAVVSGLPAQDQLLLGLLFDQELDAAGAGRVLGIEASGVRMRKKRLLEKLARKLAGLWP
ncbi:MAG: sigma-70 family RNA polymerase sigma factor [bacterium]